MTQEHEDELVLRARARCGAVLSAKYRLDSLLGVGGMASVYAATHLRNANCVAVKVLHRELAVDPGLRARFLREGYAANSVGHRGTVRVLDDDVDPDGSVFLVMDLLEGESLDARWEQSGRRLELHEVVRLTADLLDVLGAAHGKGVVHRDLKPENLFLTRDGVLKVLDFGVARLRETSSTKTKVGAVFGTPAFMPPEQALGRTEEVDALSDVWAIGATAFAFLSGRFVHEGQTVEETLVLAATRPAPPLRSVAGHVPAAVAQVIDRALAFEKTQRWPSALAMRAALLAAPLGARDDEAERAAAGDEKTRLARTPAMTAPGGAPSPSPAPPPEGGPEPPAVPGGTIAGVEADYAPGLPRRKRVAVLLTVGGLGLAAGTAIAIVLAKGSPPPEPPLAATQLAPMASASPSVPPPPIAPVAETAPVGLAPVPVETLPVASAAPVVLAPPATVPAPIVAAHTPPATVPAPIVTAHAPPAPPPSSHVAPPPPAKKRDPLAP